VGVGFRVSRWKFANSNIYTYITTNWHTMQGLV
jgi:hypothetical protein